jgi:hypothetical protein
MMPKNNLEYLFMVITLIASAILNAIIFGDIAGLVYSLQKEESKIQSINDRNNEVMEAIKNPEDLREQIRFFTAQVVKV